jgi:hypothetical protein
MEIYEFLHTDCIYESAYRTVSVHRTKKGAYKAMRAFLEREYTEWRDNNILLGKDPHKFGVHEDWKIGTIELLD